MAASIYEPVRETAIKKDPFSIPPEMRRHFNISSPVGDLVLPVDLCARSRRFPVIDKETDCTPYGFQLIKND